MIMKSEKRKQFIVGLLVGIIIMILLVSVLVVTDVIRFTNKIDNENQIQESANSNLNNVTNQDDSVQNNESEQENSIEGKFQLDIDKLSKYKNYDGTYGYFKTIYMELNNEPGYKALLTIDGNVKVCYIDNCQTIYNHSNVIDIVQLDYSEGNIDLFILSNDGQVYKYSLANYNNNNFEVTKLENINQVEKIIEYNYCPKSNAGCSWGLIAITEHGEYIEIGNATV